MLVRVRARRHVVEEILAPSTGRRGEQHLVSLACIEDDAAGERSAVYWETEPDARVLSTQTPIRHDRLDAPERFAAWYHALRWSSLSVADTARFQAPYRAGISVESYQFEPLERALRQPRVNLFIADDVGLGKTIEAALIVRELLLRQRLRRVVIAAPAGVVSQWREELDTRFGLTFVVVDREYLRARRRERGWQFNPWKAHTRFIVSHALLRDPHYTAPLIDLLKSDRAGSLLVLDEAHHAAPSSGGRIAVDSAFTRTLRDLAPRFEHRVFLSATPHNGHSNSFSALMDLLDPTRFVRGIPVEPALRKEVMVRRLKSELRTAGVEFPQREVVRVEFAELPADDPDLAIPRLLDRYAELRESLGGSLSRRKQQELALVLGNLRKRLLSSVRAFERTLLAHRRGIDAQGVADPTVDPAELDAPGADDDRATLDPEQLELSLGDAMTRASASLAAQALSLDAVALLNELSRLAAAHARRPDARVRHLLGWIREHMLTGSPARWNQRRLIVFTEYVDTQRYLVDQLRAGIPDVDLDRRIDTLDGQPDHAAHRDDVRERFNTDPAREPLRILVCTDAAREGINLHAHCADLFHFDLPWNPSRLEQRNGRIDRKGQPAEKVRCHYFAWKQRPEDKVLTALVEKTETIKAELGSLGEVILARIERALKNGITARNAEKLAQQIKFDFVRDDGTEDEAKLRVREARRELDEVADAAQIQAARKRNEDLRDRAERAMGFSQDAFRSALDAALAIVGAPPLAQDPKDPSLWHFPPIDGSAHSAPAHASLRAGDGRIDRSWAETLDTLRFPPGREPGFVDGRYDPRDRWAWRRHSRLRPLRFRATATPDENSVHMHLEHRVAQRLLGQFQAQGFTRESLSRVTVLPTEQGRDYVVLLGRLALFGRRGQRLHDEILSVGAQWTGAPDEHGQRAEEPRATEEGAWRERLTTALTHPSPTTVSTFHQQRFLHAVPYDVRALEPALRRLATSRDEVTRTQLQREGTLQADSLRALLEKQRERLAAQVEGPDLAQGTLPNVAHTPEELQTLQANRRYWIERRGALDAEIAAAPEEIRAGYDVLHSHFELIGLVYLTRQS